MQGYFPCHYIRVLSWWLLQHGERCSSGVSPREFLSPPRCPRTASFLRKGSSAGSLLGQSAMRTFGGGCRDRCEAAPLTISLRASHANAVEGGGGYYRLARANQIALDECVYEVHTKRGGGPGGQGTNSSSSKVELRVDMEMLSGFFEEEIMNQIRKNESQKALTRDGMTLVVSCHEHRSAFQNKEACIQKVKKIIQKASWVPLVDAELIQTPSHTISQSKTARRIKGNFGKMRRVARKGLW